MLTSEQIRLLRKKFWEDPKRKHKWLPPDKLVPTHGDTTAMFTLAGMQQLVPYLMWKKHPLWTRLYNIQKCVRTNDIDEVWDERHLTFFEMMWNWSLGDYFKKEAINRSFEFLTEYLGISKDKLGATIFKWEENIPMDKESMKIWEELWIPKERIKPLWKDDNFRGPAWEIWPCWPCTEIYFDRWDLWWENDWNLGENDRYLEIRNDVFMEYYKGEVWREIWRGLKRWRGSEENSGEIWREGKIWWEKVLTEKDEVVSEIDKKTYKIIWIAIDIQKKHGGLLTEKQYQRILADRLKQLWFKVELEKSIEILDSWKKYGERFADLVVDNEIVIELKNTNSQQEYKKAIKQLRAYLEKWWYKVWLVLNFWVTPLWKIRLNWKKTLQTSSENSSDLYYYTPLPQKNVDTGMGLERITMVMQWVPTVFETDLFEPILSKISEILWIKYPLEDVYWKNIENLSDNQKQNLIKKVLEKVKNDSVLSNILRRFRIIADHIRAAVFLIADGVVPSNEGRWYVLRRLIRRLYYNLILLKQLNTNEINRFVDSLVEVIVSKYWKWRPEIKEEKDSVKRILLNEILKFRKTIDKWLSLITNFISKLEKEKNKVIPSEIIFKLYDTYGFPVELIEEIASSHGIKVDVEWFKKLMKEAKDRSRQATKTVFKRGIDWWKYLKWLPQTEFIGYEKFKETEVKLLKDFEVEIDGKKIRVLIFDKTPFYAEWWWQTADKWKVILDNWEELEVYDVQKYAGVYLHFVRK